MKLNFFGREIILGKEVVVIGTSALLLLGCLVGYIFLRVDNDIIIEGAGKPVSAAVTGAAANGIGDGGKATKNGTPTAQTSTLQASSARTATANTQGTDAAYGSAFDNSARADDTICVYVVGCVKRPGIVTIKKGQMINDAVKAAGGLTSEADAENINLVYSLNENVMLNIKSKHAQGKEQTEPSGETAANKQAASGKQAQGKQPVSAEKQSAGQQASAPKQAAPLAGNSAEIMSGSGSSALVTGESGSDGSSLPEAGKAKNLVNINTAEAGELDTLPGVGEATARDIIAFREKNGRFNRIEDIMKVPRIKQNRFDSIKDFITVD